MSTPHNEAKLEDIAKTVIMPGDPLRAKYIATKPLTEIADKYGSPCGNTDEYDKLLNLFDMYFQRHVQIGGGWAYGEK